MDLLKNLLIINKSSELNLLNLLINSAKIISTEVGTEVLSNQLKYHQGKLKVNTESVIRSEIYLHKQRIIKEINKISDTFIVTDIY